MEDVEGLARNTDREVADWRTTLSRHNKTLNAMGDKIDLFQKRVDERFDKLESDLRAEMRKGFTEIGLGMGQITALLNIHLGEPGKETSAGDAGE